MRKFVTLLSILFAFLLVYQGAAFAGAACSLGMNADNTVKNVKKAGKQNFSPKHTKAATQAPVKPQ